MEDLDIELLTNCAMKMNLAYMFEVQTFNFELSSGYS